MEPKGKLSKKARGRRARALENARKRFRQRKNLAVAQIMLGRPIKGLRKWADTAHFDEDSTSFVHINLKGTARKHKNRKRTDKDYGATQIEEFLTVRRW